MNVGFTLSFDSLIHHFYRRHTNRCFVWGSPWKARVWAVWSGAQQSLTRKKLESSWKHSCQYQALKNSSAFKNKKELNIWKIFSVLWKNFQLRVLCILIILKEYPEFHAIKDSGVFIKIHLSLIWMCLLFFDLNSHLETIDTQLVFRK